MNTVSAIEGSSIQVNISCLVQFSFDEEVSRFNGLRAHPECGRSWVEHRPGQTNLFKLVFATSHIDTQH